MNTLNKEYIPYCLPDLSEAELSEVTAVLHSGWLAKGPRTTQFENEFADYVGAKYAVGMNSCTASLHIALVAAGIGPGDEVITTPMTFAASANTILHAGATPIFVDIDPDTGNMDVSQIEARLTPRTKAIVPVHYGGQACDIDPIYELADQYGLFVSEDAAHAVYTQYKNRLIGHRSKGAVSFSFYSTKNLATGEGGMLVTDQEEIANKARMLVTHGMSRNAWSRYAKGGSWMYDIEEPGYKYNMFDLIAALGLKQLERLNIMQLRREAIASRYQEAFSALEGIELPKTSSFTTTHSWHLFMIKISDTLQITRDQFIEELGNRQIGTSVHFIPVHLMSAYRKRYGYARGDYPQAEKWFDQILSLPLYSAMTDEQVERVIEAVTGVVSQYRGTK